MLTYWLYVSKAKVPPRSGDDALIYLQAKNRNCRRGLTGYLHREGDHYVQYVEGPSDGIERLRRRILVDPRHHDLRIVAEGPLALRRFTGWDMAFTRGRIPTFDAFQARRGGGRDITAARAGDILAFMEEMTGLGAAACVSDLAG